MITLRSRSLVFWVAICTGAMIFVQIAIGSSLLVLALSLVALIAGFGGFLVVGAYNAGAWVLFFYLLGNIIVALFGKTLMGQALDTNLSHPIDSFFVVAITSLSMTGALLLVRSLQLGAPLFRQCSQVYSLKSISWGSFLLGVIFSLLNQSFQDGSDDSFGGFAVFSGFLQMAVIARTALLIKQTQFRHSFDAILGLMILVGFFLGLLDNTKTNAVLPVISYFTTVLFYRGGVPVRHAVVAVMVGFVFVALVAPMIHILRGLGQQQLDIEHKVGLVSNALIHLVERPGDLFRSKQEVISNFSGGYYRYFGDNGTGQMVLGRYSSVQQIDPVIAEVNRQGSVGGSAIWPAFYRLMPRLIFPEKPKYTESYNTLIHYRLIDHFGGKFPTLPLAGQVYAAYGIAGVFFIPFFVYLFFFIVLKKVGWRLEGNIFAIFFLSNFVITYASQGDFGQYVGAIVRNFPLFLLSFWVLSRCSQYYSKLSLGRL